MPEPIQAGLWGLVAASALLIGAVAALTLPCLAGSWLSSWPSAPARS